MGKESVKSTVQRISPTSSDRQVDILEYKKRINGNGGGYFFYFLNKSFFFFLPPHTIFGHKLFD